MPMTIGDYIARARSRIQEIPAEELDNLLEDNEPVLIIDVREPEEFATGHIPGAILIPRGTLEAAADPTNPHRVEPLCCAQERMVVVCCESGARSALAADTLQEMGFARVRNLAGGCILWEAEGLPLATGG
ncbi:rhodanese-like domain-containing protein [Acidiferrobacter sp.]|uniref:rhodanese-like domain-containing protein n=1 Tax=Acidiferrobacter sp. TaxID=1872107 RepID=UPI00262D7D09|nr:rhodanese-like domain-containing protein [Acidiferrobacter sp.]